MIIIKPEGRPQLYKSPFDCIPLGSQLFKPQALSLKLSVPLSQ